MSVREVKTAQEWYEQTTALIEHKVPWESLSEAARARWETIAVKRAKGELIND